MQGAALDRNGQTCCQLEHFFLGHAGQNILNRRGHKRAGLNHKQVARRPFGDAIVSIHQQALVFASLQRPHARKWR